MTVNLTPVTAPVFASMMLSAWTLASEVADARSLNCFVRKGGTWRRLSRRNNEPRRLYPAKRGKAVAAVADAGPGGDVFEIEVSPLPSQAAVPIRLELVTRFEQVGALVESLLCSVRQRVRRSKKQEQQQLPRQ